MHESWKAVLADEFRKDYFNGLVAFVESERLKYTVYPPLGEVFTAFQVTPFDKVRVVILGQDPYHGPGQAHGLSFSVKPGVTPPPSLKNIYKELEADLGIKPVTHGHLLPWAEQGVFLLNATLTVRANEPGSHQGKGWEALTDAVIKTLNARPGQDPIVFVLWGRYAQNKRMLIDESRHTVIASAHPSPMSAAAGFFGSKPFSKINLALTEAGRGRIDWQLPTTLAAPGASS